jgi:hypothetical protein
MTSILGKKIDDDPEFEERFREIYDSGDEEIDFDEN